MVKEVKEILKKLLPKELLDKYRKIKINFIKIKRNYFYPIVLKNKTKIFCIGLNKTGTTTLKQAFIDLNFVIGNQRDAERLLPYYVNNDFNPIIKYCETGQFFQDIPFSCPNTYKHIDKAYPNSKFILTIRDNPEQWYNSLVNFHAKKFGNGKIPTKEDLEKATYIENGYGWKAFSNIFKTPEDDIYNKKILVDFYNNYNNEIKEYFKNRENDFIIINVAVEDDYKKLVNFLGIYSPFNNFAWKNKTNYKVKNA